MIFQMLHLPSESVPERPYIPESLSHIPKSVAARKRRPESKQCGPTRCRRLEPAVRGPTAWKLRTYHRRSESGGQSRRHNLPGDDGLRPALGDPAAIPEATEEGAAVDMGVWMLGIFTLN